jgi:hypothetical protein
VLIFPPNISTRWIFICIFFCPLMWKDN